ncbi:MAG: TrkA C-terminal domain-containing protein [Eubacteriaceae bacterium]
MGFNISLISFFILIIIYLLVMEIFTVLFRLTGLREDKARFQAISCMTNSGFTTKESELILNSVPRRHLARIMMIFGYLFAVTGVSLLVNLFIRSSPQEINWRTLIYSITFLIVFITVTRSKWLVGKFDRLIEKIVSKRGQRQLSNNVRIYDMYHEKIIAEVFVTCPPSEIIGKTIGEINIKKKYQLNILLIRRGKLILDNIEASDMILKGDRVLIYGSKVNIMDLFQEEH